MGSILYSRAKVVSDAGFAHVVLTFGPLSVLPKWQGWGLAGRLGVHSRRPTRHPGEVPPDLVHTNLDE